VPGKRSALFRQKLANMFELPKDIVLDLPRITLLGSLQVTVQNHRGILEYTPEKVTIGISAGQLRITGADMVIGIVCQEEIMVTGRIQEIAFI